MPLKSTFGAGSVSGFGAGGGGSSYIVATGGTITTVNTDYKVHTFTGPGTFCVSAGSGALAVADYMVIAGGGGGGGGRGGGGGAGGFRESPGTASGCYTASPLGTSPAVALPISVTGYPITIGAGGTAGVYLSSLATPGGVSIFSTITSAGGGKGGNEAPCGNGSTGGSGGASTSCGPYFAGNTPPVSPPQGNDSGLGGSPVHGGGGGGASAAGNPSTFVGGAGATTSISSSPTIYGGGGGAGSNGGASAGGAGGGGAGSNNPSPGVPGSSNTGGGAGGGRGTGARTSGGAGGSGIVIIRYKFQ